MMPELPRIVIEAETCPGCSGRGWVSRVVETPGGTLQGTSPTCPTCNGRGWVWPEWADTAIFNETRAEDVGKWTRLDILHALHAAMPKEANDGR